MGLLKVIEWVDESKDVIVHKIDLKGNSINKGSVLTVRDGQVAIFANNGKMADVFLPGMYKLDTDSLPIITKLLSWKYGFEKPFKSDVYFVKTTQFIDQKWGTSNPILVRDKDYGGIRIRSFGTYSFKVEDAYVFMQEVSGAGMGYHTSDITTWLKSLIVTEITDAIAESKLPILELSANLHELGDVCTKVMQKDFSAMGMKLVRFNLENISLPEELEKRMDQNAGLNMLRGNMDIYTTMAAADAMKDAAKNPNGGGVMSGMMGAGMGLGMGVGVGNMFGNAMGQSFNGGGAQTIVCPKCRNQMAAMAKFCPVCGAANGEECKKCHAVSPVGTKFCPDCGNPLGSVCPGCGASVLPNAKFCPDCGQKL